MPDCQEGKRSVTGAERAAPKQEKQTTRLVLSDAVKGRLGSAGTAADAQRLALAEALCVRDLRLERLELALRHVERRRLEPQSVET